MDTTTQSAKAPSGDKYHQLPDLQKQPCAKCKKPPTRICVGCMDGPLYINGAQPTWYCTLECQMTHWDRMPHKEDAHKTVCISIRAVIMLYRSAHILQGFWFCYRNAANQVDVSHIMHWDHKVDVYVKEHSEKKSCVQKIGFWIPQDMKDIKTTESRNYKPGSRDFTDEDIRLAILVHNSVREIEMFRPMINKFLTVIPGIKGAQNGYYNGLSDVPLEVTIHSDAMSDTMVTSPLSGEKSPYRRACGIEVLIEGGRRYVVDLGAAEHGYEDHISPLGTYQANRMMVDARHEPWQKVDLTEFEKENPAGGKMRKLVLDAMDYFIAQWFSEEYKGPNGLTGLLLLREDLFEEQKVFLIDYVEEKLEQAPRNEDGTFKPIVPKENAPEEVPEKNAPEEVPKKNAPKKNAPKKKAPKKAPKK